MSNNIYTHFLGRSDEYKYPTKKYLYIHISFENKNNIFIHTAYFLVKFFLAYYLPAKTILVPGMYFLGLVR